LTWQSSADVELVMTWILSVVELSSIFIPCKVLAGWN